MLRRYRRRPDNAAFLSSHTCTDKVKAKRPPGPDKPDCTVGRGESSKAVRKGPIAAPPLRQHRRIPFFVAIAGDVNFSHCNFRHTCPRARDPPHSNEFCEFLQMDELRGKSREIEKLSKLLKRRKLAPAKQETVSICIYWRVSASARNVEDTWNAIKNQDL